jgi:hypothetical protein
MPEVPGAPNIRVKVPGSRGAGSGGDTFPELKFSSSRVTGIWELKKLVKLPSDDVFLSCRAGGGGAGGAGLALFRAGSNIWVKVPAGGGAGSEKGSGFAGAGERNCRVNSPGSSRFCGGVKSGCPAAGG